MSEYARPIKALGEVVLRVSNLDTMQEFYEKVVGLELLERSENMMAFFRIAPDYEGHTQSLALFDQSGEATIDRAIILEWILRRARCITWPLQSHYQITKRKKNDCKILAWMWKRSNTFGSIIVRFI
jgi:hypothetical protein